MVIAQNGVVSADGFRGFGARLLKQGMRDQAAAVGDARGHLVHDFILNGKMPLVLKEGTLTDEQLLAGLTEKKALQIVKSGNKKEIAANGLENFRRDTSYVSVYESLFSDILTIDKVKDLCVIPFSNGQKFEMETRMHTNASSGIVIPLFEARAPYDTYLSDLNRQELVNLKDQQTKLEKYNGLKVGSVDEPNNNAGNWE